MAYAIGYQLVVYWIPDGAGPMSVPAAQRLRLGGAPEFEGVTFLANATTGQPTAYQTVPGGATPTIGNFNTALTGSSSTPTGGMALDLSTALSTNLARIQGFATGGG